MANDPVKEVAENIVFSDAQIEQIRAIVAQTLTSLVNQGNKYQPLNN